MPLIMDQPEAKPFRFMDLLPKIRQRVYEHVLVSEAPIEIHEATRRRRSSVSRGTPVEAPGRISALLRTNKQIRREAAPFFFSRNTFVIPWGFPNLGVRWLDYLTPQHRRLLRDVRFCYGDGAFWTIYDARTALSSLRLALERSGALADLKEMTLWVPVCEFSVHTWKELHQREDAEWVSMDGTRPFNKSGAGKL